MHVQQSLSFAPQSPGGHVRGLHAAPSVCTACTTVTARIVGQGTVGYSGATQPDAATPVLASQEGPPGAGAGRCSNVPAQLSLPQLGRAGMPIRQLSRTWTSSKPLQLDCGAVLFPHTSRPGKPGICPGFAGTSWWGLGAMRPSRDLQRAVCRCVERGVCETRGRHDE